MNFFDRILTQPIFNILALIYGVIGDFGVAIIILTIIVRLILWPLVKKQLRQTKLMRAIQPELKTIKKKSGGNKMLESQMMMELYREKGVKPFSSILVLVIQLPIFFALFRVIQIFSANYQAAQHVSPDQFIYPFLQNFAKIPELLANHATHLFGLIDLTKTAGNYFPALIIALIAASFQFWQSKQIMPQSTEKRKLRDMFRDAKDGKDVDQAEMAAATTGKMIYFFPLMTFVIALALPAAVVLYYATTSCVAVIQQHFVLNRDESDLEKLANEKPKKPSRFATIMQNAREMAEHNYTTKSGGSREKSDSVIASGRGQSKNSAKSNKSSRETNAVEAEIITMKPSEHKNLAKTNSTSSGGKTVVRRIKAK